MSFHVLRFNRASPRYESEAGIQFRMAGRLLDLLDIGGKGPDFSSLLEFGCGTGILTRKLRKCFPKAFILATDAAPAMLAEAAASLTEKTADKTGSLEFAPQNAEGFAEISRKISARAPFDATASNALVQWFPDLENHLRLAWRLTRPKGAYLLSGFEHSNFPELNSLLSEPPFSYRSFPGHDSGNISALGAKAGWKLEAVETWEEKETLPSARDILRRLQSLGSTRDPAKGGRLNRRSLQHLISEYERRFSGPGGVRLTWRPWVARLTRN